MPVFQETRNTIRQAIGRQSGLLVGTFAVTTGSPLQISSRELRLRSADQGARKWLYIYTGGGAAQGRLSHSAYAPGSPGDAAILYVAPSFATTPSTNSSFELWERIDPSNVNNFIDDAIRQAARRILGHKEDFGVILDSVIGRDGSFTEWPNGTSSAPRGWTLVGTGAAVTRNSSLRYSGPYSAEVLSDGTNEAVLEYDVPNYARFAGRTVTVYVKVFTRTSGRVRVRVDDGISTSNSPYHGATNGWDGQSTGPLSIARTLDANIARLRVGLRIESGSAVTAYWGKVWVDDGAHIYEYDLPRSNSTDTAFANLSEIWVENDVDGVFNVQIPNTWYDVNRDSIPRKLIFHRGKMDEWLKSGRQVKLVGQARPRLPGADTDNLEVDPEYVRRQAGVNLLDSLGWNEMDRSKRDRWAREAQEYLAAITTTPYPDALPIENW